jgi:hypothetical protein
MNALPEVLKMWCIAIGVLAEHWDVLQDEATKAEPKCVLPMFGQQLAD